MQIIPTLQKISSALPPWTVFRGCLVFLLFAEICSGIFGTVSPFGSYGPFSFIESLSDPGSSRRKFVEHSVKIATASKPSPVIGCLDMWELSRTTGDYLPAQLCSLKARLRSYDYSLDLWPTLMWLMVGTFALSGILRVTLELHDRGKGIGKPKKPPNFVSQTPKRRQR